jgi:hypothetical protein
MQRNRDEGQGARRGVLGLLLELDARGIELTRHGGFIGVKGPGVHLLPEQLWADLDEHEGALLGLPRNTPTPFRQRQGGRRRGAAPGGV